MILAQDVIEQAEKAAHLSDRGVMFLMVLVMGGVVVFLYRDMKQTTKFVIADMEKSSQTLEARRDAMDQERINRINMLMELIKQNNETYNKMADALQHNTSVMEELKQAVTELRSTIASTCKTT